MENIDELRPVNSEKPKTNVTEFTWLAAKYLEENVPGWHAFMEIITQSRPFHRYAISYLPFINNPPSNLETIYTTLRFAQQKSKASNQKACIVTYDLPLWNKARTLISRSFKHIGFNFKNVLLVITMWYLCPV